MSRPHRQILVIRFSSIGDILLTTPALRALKRWDPDAEIHFLLKAGYEDLVRENPNVDRVIPFDPSGGVTGLIGLAKRLRGAYDLVIDLQRSARSMPLRHALGAGRVLTYPKGVMRRFVMIRTGWKAIAPRVPVPERYLRALSPLGIHGDGGGIDLTIPEAVRQRIQERLAVEIAAAGLSDGLRSDTERDWGGPPCLALAPGARWATKRWPPERFAAVADTLATTHGLIPVILGGGHDLGVSGSVRKEMRVPALDFAGRLSLLETASVIATSRLLISNDSGLMHMATAVGIPVVAIFGPTTRELGFFPYRGSSEVVESDIGCRPCHHLGGDRCPQGHFRCMREIDPDAVVDAAGRLLGSHHPSGVPSGRGDALPR